MIQPVFPLNYQRGPDDCPSDVDRWQLLEHCGAGACCHFAAKLMVIASAVLILGFLLGRPGAYVTVYILIVGWAVLLLAALTSTVAALLAWSANRYSRGAFPQGPLRAALRLMTVAVILFVCSCLVFRWRL